MLKMGDLSGTGCSFSIVADGAGLLFFYSLLCTELFNVGSKASLKGKNALLETKKTANVKRPNVQLKWQSGPKCKPKKLHAFAYQAPIHYSRQSDFFPANFGVFKRAFFMRSKVILGTLQRIFFHETKPWRVIGSSALGLQLKKSESSQSDLTRSKAISMETSVRTSMVTLVEVRTLPQKQQDYIAI